MPKFHSLCARETQDLRTTKPHILPLYQTASFKFEDIDQGIRIFSKEEKGHVYSRYGNPTAEAVASKIAAMESHGMEMEAEGILFSSGQAALYTLVMSLLQSGDKILTQGNLYGGSTELLQKVCSRSGIDIEFTDLSDYTKVEETVSSDERLKLIFFETPSNPTMQCVDIRTLSGIAERHGLYSAIDNTLPTPYLQQPLRFGIDFIMHSTTKHLNGHGNAIGGALIGRDREFMRDRVWSTMKLLGNQPGPMDAWLTYQGIKTLPIRLDKHCANAQAIAEYLERHPNVAKVNYAGLPSHPDHEIAQNQMRAFGGVLSFEVKGGYEAGLQFMRKLQFCILAPTFGDLDTLVLHPASSSHLNVSRELREANGITDGLIRLSVGIEDVEDIIADVEQALG